MLILYLLFSNAGKGGRPKSLDQNARKAFEKDIKKGLSLEDLSKKYSISKSTAYRERKKIKALL